MFPVVGPSMFPPPILGGSGWGVGCTSSPAWPPWVIVAVVPRGWSMSGKSMAALSLSNMAMGLALMREFLFGLFTPPLL